jgi:hypothetical protein
VATITIQIVAGGNTVGRTKTVSGPHLIRFLAAYKALLGQVVDVAAHTENGVFIPATYRDLTDDECVLAWADGLLAGTKSNVLRQEQTAAASTATQAVTEIAYT